MDGYLHCNAPTTPSAASICPNKYNHGHVFALQHADNTLPCLELVVTEGRCIPRGSGRRRSFHAWKTGTCLHVSDCLQDALEKFVSAKEA